MAKLNLAEIRRQNANALKQYERFGTKLFTKALKEQAKEYDPKIMEKAYLDFYDRVFIDSVKKEYNRIRVREKVFAPSDFFLSMWRAWIQDWVLTNLGTMIASVNANTLSKIQETLAMAIEQGLNPFMTARLLASQVGSVTRARAIARTESTRANAMGKEQSANQWASESGQALWKVWVHGGSREPRIEHQQAQNKPIPKDAFFEFTNPDGQVVLMQKPGDFSGGASQTVNCFPYNELTKIDLSKVKRVFRSKYKGILINVKFANGDEFTCTPKHPILTDKGWISAMEINNSTNLVDASSVQSLLGNFNVNNIPTKIGKIFDSSSVKRMRMRVRGIDVNFHGYIPNSDVDIVNVNSFLRNRVKSFFSEFFDKGIFKRTYFAFSQFFGNSLFNCRLVVERLRFVSHSLISTFGNINFLNIGVIRKPSQIGFVSISNCNTIISQNSPNNISSGFKFRSNKEFGVPIGIKLKNFFNRNIFSSNPFKMFNSIKRVNNCFDSVIVTAENISDFCSTQSANVKFKNPISVNVLHDFDDYVYTLETNNQMYELNGIIAKNCSCTIVYISERFARRNYPEAF